MHISLIQLIHEDNDLIDIDADANEIEDAKYNGNILNGFEEYDDDDNELHGHGEIDLENTGFNYG